MSGPRGLRIATELPAYRAAAAQLPVTAVPLDPAGSAQVRGALVVVPGVGPWWRGILAARDAGAAAAIVADPVTVPPEAAEVLAVPPGIPVIVERPRLRADLAGDALSGRAGGPTLISIEAAAASAGFEAVLRDAVGWARTLTGPPEAGPVLRSAAATPHGRMALLDAGPPDGAVPVSLLAAVLQGKQCGGLVKVLALGTVRTEVTIDQQAGLARVQRSTADGDLVAPARFEASARLALRRAAAACADGREVADLRELLLDAAVVSAMSFT
ncbi:hypothetical protein JHV56_11595 [Arthrobacter sp. BHU FT2]|nr:hypothetical protein [Arthrobacter sp. BHU FT2]